MGTFRLISLTHFLRYIFKSEKKVGIQELGPRFTLKLRSLQKGTFDSKYGEYEWVHKVCAYSMKSHLGSFKKDGMRIKP